MGGKGKDFGKGAKGKGADKGKGDAKGKGKGKGKGKAEASPLDDLLGTELQAMYEGTLYKATVVQVRKKAPELKVRYSGYEDLEAVWVGVDDIRSKVLKGGAGGKGAAGAGGSKSGGELPPEGSLCKARIAPDSQLFPAEVTETSTAAKRAKAPVRVLVDMWLPAIAIHAVQKPPGTAAKGYEKYEYDDWGYAYEEPVAKGKGKSAKGAKGAKGGKNKGGKGYDDYGYGYDYDYSYPSGRGSVKGKGKDMGKGKGKSKGKGKGKDYGASW